MIPKLDIAVSRYHAAGLRPILLWGLTRSNKCACGREDCDGSRGKHPTAAKWQSQQFTLTTLLDELKRGPRNVGLSMGAQPRGDALIAVDCDGPDALLDEWEFRLGCELPPTLFSVTRRGKHLLYSVPDGVVIGNRARILGNAKGSPDLDIRGEHGQIVAPPSMHYSGHQYRWGNVLPIATLPDRIVDWLTRPAPTPERAPSGNVPRETAFQRAEKYMSKIPPAISGQGGHNDTFIACRKLVSTFSDLTESDYWTLLCRWNETCSPPWSERELKHKLSEALK
jgi:hypothetical protein